MKWLVQVALVSMWLMSGLVLAQDGEVGKGVKERVEAPEQASAGPEKATEKKLILERGHHHIIRRTPGSGQSGQGPNRASPLNDHRRLN